ncbi:MAG: hypothetical protein ACMUHY_04970, partial [Thermoplasmatota archaeon]
TPVGAEIFKNGGAEGTVDGEDGTHLRYRVSLWSGADDGADNDQDGDGRTDLEEYEEGSDPTKKPESGGSAILVLIPIAVVILVIIGVVLFMIIRGRRGKESASGEEGKETVDTEAGSEKTQPTEGAQGSETPTPGGMNGIKQGQAVQAAPPPFIPGGSSASIPGGPDRDPESPNQPSGK